MTIERVERYAIEPCADGIVLRMRQGRRALGVALVSIAVLLASWWFGPYGPRPASEWARSDSFYWLWSAFFSLVSVLGLVGALYREDWTIAGQDIVVTNSLGPWCRTRRVRRARPLGIRVEIVPGADEGRAFPYRLRFLDAEQHDSGLCVELQRTRSVDQFLEALRGALSLAVEDARTSRRTTG